MTKLFIPSPRHNQVTRERLVQRLNDGIKCGSPLLLVSAPAGFGKTTLVSDWLQQMPADWSAAWVSLDNGDNDPALFVRYLVSAMQKADPAFEEALQPILSMAQSPGQLSLVEIGALIINAAAQSGKRLALVLDDYHWITSPEIHAFVHLLVEHNPDGLLTVLLTREDPPLPLPRLRASGQVIEIRERDLRFNHIEVQAFFDQSMGLDLLPRWVEVLETHTEGWIAGLQLAALAIQESPDGESIEQFLQTFTGSDRFIIDYLLDEVYDRQPVEIQEFLLRSAILERMCAPVCDQLLEIGADREVNGESAVLLQRLERGNLFLIPLDNQRTWYRYHHLFAELLRHRLLQEKSVDTICALHRAAGSWFEAQGDISDAIRHAFQTRDWNFSVNMVERHAMSFVSRSLVSTLLEWYRQIPELVLQERPLACIYIAWALVLTFREDYRPVVEAWLQRAEQALQAQNQVETIIVGPDSIPVNRNQYVTGQVAVIRSQNLLASFRDPVDPRSLISLSQQALDLLPDYAQLERSVCVINLALANLILSQTTAADASLVTAYQTTLSAGNYFGAVTIVWYQARLSFYRGQVARAEAICLEGLEKLKSILPSLERDLPAIRSIYVAQAIYQLERNRLDEAERSLEKSLNLTGWASWVELWAYAVQIRLQQVKGNQQGVGEWLARMTKMGPQQAVCAQGLAVLQDLLAAPEDSVVINQAREWVQAHSPDLQRYGILTGIGPYHGDALYLKDITWARVQVLLGESRAALAFVGPVLAVAENNGLVYRVVELTVLKAMALNAAGMRDEALSSIEDALSLAGRYGYLRVLDQGMYLDDLLAEATVRGGHAKFIQFLSQAFGRSFVHEAGQTNGVSIRAGKQEGLVEPLSERELEVLLLIAEGCSNAEICQRLVIALGTVKRHINNIYGKLGIQSRTQAIHKARQLNLLS